jgi:hypothetical protein
MRLLRFAINVTLDGCIDHTAGIPPDEELHLHATGSLARADALLMGRVTYRVMRWAWREPARTGVSPDWMTPWMEPFGRTIDAAKKYVVSRTLERVDWNAELVRGDLGTAVRELKRAPGRGLFVAGATLARTLKGLERSVKWGLAWYGVGNGWCFSCGGFVGHVKLAFGRGTSLRPEPPVRPIGMGRATRCVEIASAGDLDGRQDAAWMKQAAALPGFGGKKR